MNYAGLNPELIRTLVIVAFFVFSLVMRARKKPPMKGPVKPPAPARTLDLSGWLRDANRPKPGAAPLEQPRKDEFWPMQAPEKMRVPDPIQPETPWLPTLLLLALAVCLCLMAYRYWIE